MDRGGRFSQSVNSRPPEPEEFNFDPPSRFSLFLRRTAVRAKGFRFLRGIELIFLVGLLAASALYGSIRGGHWEDAAGKLHDFADQLAQSAGFQTANVVLSGAKRLSRQDVLRIAGITEKSTLFLIDAESTRERILRNPWVADAAVRKLYPDRLEIAVTEKKPFAVWQSRGMFSIVAKDGTVIDQIERTKVRDSGLPFVVGAGAEKRAAALFAMLGRFPAIKSEVAAAILVADRRWNLRLKSGIDVRLPEENPDVALMRLTALDREDHLLSRDVTVIDLRLTDRTAVRLSDDAAQIRDAAVKARAKKKGANI